ncbi:MAG TPA: AraC family transcriptional regulator [Candidatus Eisenbacteria bacterium]|nr:AraC family transcriptional regulator [Candidatus Eisenbacteria bacterium]
MAAPAHARIGEERLTGGNFYGSVLGKQSVAGAIFTDLNHSQPRKLPAHSHELPFFCLFFGGDYAEKYGHRDVQFRPFTFSFRPAGVPHQDEIGPRGARMFGIEVERGWQRSVQDCPGTLGVAYDFEGGPALWLALKLYAGTRAPLAPRDLQVESLVSELLGAVACKPERCTVAPFWLRRVHEKLHVEFRERLTMHDLAREAGVHPVHLSRVFRKFTGRGIGEYVHRLRIREACERMLDREASLANISCDLGFADQSHFTRIFHGITGFNPGAFRAMLLREAIRSARSLQPRRA